MLLVVVVVVVVVEPYLGNEGDEEVEGGGYAFGLRGFCGTTFLEAGAWLPVTKAGGLFQVGYEHLRQCPNSVRKTLKQDVSCCFCFFESHHITAYHIAHHIGLIRSGTAATYLGTPALEGRTVVHASPLDDPGLAWKTYGVRVVVPNE